jgi:hypothetical protein
MNRLSGGGKQSAVAGFGLIAACHFYCGTGYFETRSRNFQFSILQL